MILPQSAKSRKRKFKKSGILARFFKPGDATYPVGQPHKDVSRPLS
jgi:hypothetical protein